MRYNSDGTWDSSFGAGGIVLTSLETYSSVYSIAIEQGGKLIAAGTTGDNSNAKMAMVKYHTDGTLDSSFGIGGKVTTDFDTSCNDIATSRALLPGGKILLAGYSGDFWGYCNPALLLARYAGDGTLD